MPATATSLQPGIVLTENLQDIVTASNKNAALCITGAVFSNPGDNSATLTVTIIRNNMRAILIPALNIGAKGTSLAPELAGRILNTGDSVRASGKGIHCVVDGYLIT